jgi:hypothetical protein
MSEERISTWVKFLALPLFGTVLTGFFTWFQNQREIRENNIRIYAELMSQREGADSALRKDMFSSIIGTFLKPASGSVNQQILHLELLANNFHEALDLSPLFKHVHRELEAEADTAHKDAFLRLEKLAEGVTSKELVGLAEAGSVRVINIDLQNLAANPGGIEVFNGDLQMRNDKTGETRRRFILNALSWDQKRREGTVRMRVGELTYAEPSETPINPQTFEIDDIFVVGFFEFPLVDNTHLSKGQRCAIILNEVHAKEGFLKASLAYFPASRASLKDKPYYDEVLEQLRESGQFEKQ